MSVAKLRWGFLSTAKVNRLLLPALRSSLRNLPLAVASRDLQRARSFADECDIPRAYGSYEALLQDPDVDVVYVSLPNGMHAEWAIHAAKAGKHILCEKPLAMNTREVDAMAEEASRAGVVLAEALMYRHHPLTKRVKEVVDGGAIGEVLIVRGSFSIDLSNNLNDIRLDPELGGGSIWDVGSYPISYARYVVGAMPSRVFAHQVTGPSGVDELLVGQMQYESGTLAVIDCGFRSPYRTRLEIVGSQGAIGVPFPFEPDRHASLLLTRADGTAAIDVDGAELYQGEIEDMADAILLGNPCQVGISESRDNIATMEALVLSATENRPVTLN